MGVRIKNYIFYFINYLIIFYVSKIKFKKSRITKECSKKLKRSFINFILKNKTKCQK